MRTFSILPLIFLFTVSAYAQGVESFMSPIWIHGGLSTMLIPAYAEPEPLNRLGATAAPVQWAGRYVLPVELPNPKPGKPGTWRVMEASVGLGEFLELKGSQNLSLEGYAGGPVAADPGGFDLWYTIQDKNGVLGLAWHGYAGGRGVFAFNNKSFSIAYPAFDYYGSKLYFASQQPGGHGGWDIWYSVRQGNEWGSPVNMGPEVNSPGDELYPAIGPEHQLIFSSNGHSDNWGGFDLYGLGPGDKRYLLPYPYNTIYDDLTYRIGEQRRLYVSSNRPPVAEREPGKMNVYRLTPKAEYTAYVSHSRFGHRLGGVPVKVTKGFTQTADLRTKENGEFTFYLDPGARYSFSIATELYDTIRQTNIEIGTTAKTIQLLEKKYKMVTIAVMEDGKKYRQGDAWVRIDQNGSLLDSIQIDTSGQFKVDLQPNSAYKLTARLGHYPPQEQHFSTSNSNKENFSYTFAFGWPVGTYLQGKVHNPEGLGASGVELKLWRGKDPYEPLRPMVSNGTGEIWSLVGKNQRYLAVAHRNDLLGYTFVEPKSENEQQSRTDTVIFDLQLVPFQSGQRLAEFKYAPDPIALQAGNYEELVALLGLLRTVPNLKLEIGAHSDIRASAEEAYTSTKEAAEFAVDYFRIHGIDKSRLRAKAYGKSKPKHACPNNSCTEEEHIANRRIEVVIFK